MESCAALIAGLAAYLLAAAGAVWLVEPLRSRVPETKQAAFLADFWAHVAAYGVGFVGGVAICGWISFKRLRERRRA